MGLLYLAAALVRHLIRSKSIVNPLVLSLFSYCYCADLGFSRSSSISWFGFFSPVSDTMQFSVLLHSAIFFLLLLLIA